MIKIPLQSTMRIAGCRIWLVGVVLCILLTTSAGRAAERQVLPGHVPRAVSQLRALRRLEATNVLQLAIGLPLRNQGELTNLLQDIYNPASPNYRHFLTPHEFAKRFGPTEQDYQAVMEFARTNGFKVVGTHPNRVLLEVSAAVPDIERAFHLNLWVYPHPTKVRVFYAPDAEPQLDLTVPVLHISGLDNFLVPQPLCREMPAATALANPAAAEPAAGSGPSGNYAGKDFRAAYAPGVTNTGAGQLVGLLEFQGYYASDITTYEANYSLPNIPLTNVLLGGLTSITADASDAECPLDIEMAISVATNLSGVIVYCTTRSGNTDTILNQMATDNSCKQLSASWLIGADSTGLQIYQQMAAQGQSFFNASGDSDAASAAVPIVEDAPYITTVGGTTLVTTGPGGSRTSESTWNRGNGTGSTGGISPTYAIPLWQQGINMNTNQGSAFMRNVPDVACVAENVWVLYNNGGSGAFGGTSCAAPLWAGFIALANQQAIATGRPLVGFINPTIYAIGKSAGYTSDFHDITTGNNTLPSSPNRFYAFPGYDLCTGWGTPSGQNLINALVLGMGDTLMVTPTNGLTMAGPAGGPFVPASGTFLLANFAGTTDRWTLVNTSAWFTASPGSGTILSGAKANVTVTVAAAANSLPAGFYSANLLFSNQTTSVVQSFPLTLVVGTGMMWDSSAGGGAPQDGPGIWADQSSANGNTNWWTGAGDVLWTNANVEIATFGANSGAADVVTLGSAVTAAGINFNPPGSGNYTIAGGGNTLTLNGNVSANTSATINAPVTLGLPATFSVADAQTLAVSSVITGANGNDLTITGPGIVSLTGQNNTSASAGMAGNVVVNSGTLSLNSSSLYGTLGNVSGITVGSGATLSLQGVNAISGSSGMARNVTINSGGSVTNAGSGNHAIGLLTLNGGTLTGAGSPTAGSFNLTGDVFVYSNSTISAQNITQVSASSFNVNNGSTLNFSGTMIGSGGLTFAGPGTMIVSGANTYTGTTTSRAGTLQLGSGGVGGSLGTGSVVNGGVLQINRSDNFVWTTPVSDPYASGTLVKLNANTLTLQSTNAFLATSGAAVQVNGGLLQINLPGVLVSGGEFWVAQNATTASCIINGGTLISSNWIAVGRNNSAALGTLTLNAGSIQKSGGGNIIMGSLGGTGTLTVNGGTISNNAAIWLGENSTGKGTLNLNGGLVQATQVTRSTSPGSSAILNFNGGILQATTNQANFLAIDQANVQAGNAIIDDGGNVIVVSQALQNGGGGGGLIKNGSGTLTLTATNTYTGPTTVNAGTLKVSPDPVLHLSFDNVSGGTVINDGTGGAAMNGTMTGAGATVVSGGRYGNALSLNGTGAYVVISNKMTSLDCNAGGASWTYALWIKTATPGATYGYQGDGTWSSTAQTTFYLNNNNGTSGGTRAGGVRYADNWLTGTTAINNNWHFVAITVNSGTKTIYVDGNVDAKTGSTGWVDAGSATANQFRIGASPDAGDGNAFMNGLIDEVYVFSRALSQTEVQSLMTANQLGNRQVLPPATALTLAAGATFDMSSLSQTIGSLSGANGSSVLLGAGTNTSALTFGNAANTTFAGTISGTGPVTKNGAGSITLSGVNTFTGPTVINTGAVGFGQSSNSNLVALLQPVLWLTFDQIGSGVVTNLGTGGSAMNGTLVGANVSIVSGGRYGNALKVGTGSFSSSYVLVNNPVTPLNGATAGSSWTVALWVKTSASGGAYLYQGSGSWASGNTSFFLTSATQVGSGSTFPGGHVGGVRWGGGWMGGNTNVNDNNWHFIAIADNAGAKTIYVDGNLDTNYSASQLWNTAGTGNQMWIGGSADTGDGNAAFNGLIDEVYVFNRTLSQTEILNLMGNQGVDPIASSPGRLPAVSPVSLASTATLDLSGISQNIASLSDIGGNGGLVTNSSSTNVMLVLSNNTAAATTFSGLINDAGVNAIGLIKAGTATQVLAGANGYSGPTTVSGGSLLVNGSLGTSSVTVTNGMLGGNGTINGPTAIQFGGTLAPGLSGIGMLTFGSDLTLLAGSTNVMELSKGPLTNDLLNVTGTFACGGNLLVTNLEGTLAAGDSFKLFNVGGYSGAFASVSLPPLVSGLAWVTNTLMTDGTLRIVATNSPVISSFVLAGNSFLLSVTGGPASSPYRVFASTNLVLPLANWTPIWTDTFDLNGSGLFTNPASSTNSLQFFNIRVP